MTRRFLVVTLAAVAVASVIAIVPFRLAGQGGGAAPPQSVCPDDTPVKFHACALEAAKTFNAAQDRGRPSRLQRLLAPPIRRP